LRSFPFVRSQSDDLLSNSCLVICLCLAKSASVSHTIYDLCLLCTQMVWLSLPTCDIIFNNGFSVMIYSPNELFVLLRQFQGSVWPEDLKYLLNVYKPGEKTTASSVLWHQRFIAISPLSEHDAIRNTQDRKIGTADTNHTNETEKCKGAAGSRMRRM